MRVLIEAMGKRDGRCRACSRPIVWAQLAGGQMHPFDAPLVLLGEQDCLFDDRIRQVVDTTRSPSHFTTCPARLEFAHKQRRQAGGRRK